MTDPLAIPALTPRGAGHQFVVYGDSCSGVPGAPHEAIFAAVNRVVQRLQPTPDFLCFPGDAIIGLVADDAALRAQWAHWFGHELAWLDRATTPLYLTPGNHDVYDAASAAVWRTEVAPSLPANGPPGHEGMSYLVRRGDLVLVFVSTMALDRGGEGRADAGWVDRALAAHADARHKFVVGHHPVFPTNGYDAAYQRRLADDDGRALWAALVRHRVTGYLCSHLLAFDVQVHQGVLQIMTAGAGTAHRMPPETEYLHCVQLAVDDQGLRYQVLDESGRRREWLAWPPVLPPVDAWPTLDPTALPLAPSSAEGNWLLALLWRGQAAADGRGEAQTLLTGWPAAPGTAPLWIGLEGPEQRLTVLLSRAPGRSPHRWHGPCLAAGQPFDLHLLLHTGLGPGGVLHRPTEAAPWSTLTAASAVGPEVLPWPAHWAEGHGQRGTTDRPFRGRVLAANAHLAHLSYAECAADR